MWKTLYESSKIAVASFCFRTRSFSRFRRFLSIQLTSRLIRNNRETRIRIDGSTAMSSTRHLGV